MLPADGAFVASLMVVEASGSERSDVAVEIRLRRDQRRIVLARRLFPAHLGDGGLREGQIDDVVLDVGDGRRRDVDVAAPEPRSRGQDEILADVPDVADVAAVVPKHLPAWPEVCHSHGLSESPRVSGYVSPPAPRQPFDPLPYVPAP